MKRTYILTGLSCIVFFIGLLFSMHEIALAAGNGNSSNNETPGQGVSQAPDQSEVVHEGGRYNRKVCGNRKNGEVFCHARVDTDPAGNPHVWGLPDGYGPAQFLGAYGLTGKTLAKNQIIAVIDAYDHPYIQNDLRKYSQAFGIQVLPACNGSIAASAVPCFKKVDQDGGMAYPAQDPSWALEIALDVEVAHAVCQNCKILLVEARSATYDDLMTAVDRALAMGATVVSNSYGSGEFSGQSAYDAHFNHPGIAFTVSSGDAGYGAQYPASSPYVTAVGGTSLVMAANNTYGSESAWNGSGSGCSQYSKKPVWQKDISCATRTVADVSAVADPATGAAIYSTAPYTGMRGWFKMGGTSLSSPLIAGVYGLAGDMGGSLMASSLPYSRYSSKLISDIQGGSNGSCQYAYLCTAVFGYDGPTGLGSPHNIGAF